MRQCRALGVLRIPTILSRGIGAIASACVRNTQIANLAERHTETASAAHWVKIVDSVEKSTQVKIISNHLENREIWKRCT